MDIETRRLKDRLKARRRREKYGEKVREYDRQRYRENLQEVRARRARQYADNVNGVRDKALAYHQFRYHAGSMLFRMKQALCAARARAWRRDIEFSLTIEDIGTPTHCAVTGIEFDMTKSFRKGNIFVPSLDRIDPTKGYLPGNVRVVCHGYNLAKHAGTDADVLKLARAIVARADSLS